MKLGRRCVPYEYNFSAPIDISHPNNNVIHTNKVGLRLDGRAYQRTLRAGFRYALQSDQPLTPLLISLTKKYENYALYVACRKEARAGKARAKYRIKMTVLKKGGEVQSNRLIKLTLRTLKLNGLERQLAALVLNHEQ
jgi:hypothetical protein